MGFSYGLFDTHFEWFSVIFGIVFVLVIGMFVVTIVRGIVTWGRNNASPRLTVDAMVVSKREDMSFHHHTHGTASSTSYYVTFQVDSGDRRELSVTGREYGMMVEGDAGKLSFQGTRFLSFERTMG